MNCVRKKFSNVLCFQSCANLEMLRMQTLIRFYLVQAKKSARFLFEMLLTLPGTTNVATEWVKMRQSKHTRG